MKSIPFKAAAFPDKPKASKKNGIGKRSQKGGGFSVKEGVKDSNIQDLKNVTVNTFDRGNSPKSSKKQKKLANAIKNEVLKIKPMKQSQVSLADAAKNGTQVTSKPKSLKAIVPEGRKKACKPELPQPAKILKGTVKSPPCASEISPPKGKKKKNKVQSSTQLPLEIPINQSTVKSTPAEKLRVKKKTKKISQGIQGEISPLAAKKELNKVPLNSKLSKKRKLEILPSLSTEAKGTSVVASKPKLKEGKSGRNVLPQAGRNKSKLNSSFLPTLSSEKGTESSLLLPVPPKKSKSKTKNEVLPEKVTRGTHLMDSLKKTHLKVVPNNSNSEKAKAELPNNKPKIPTKKNRKALGKVASQSTHSTDKLKLPTGGKLIPSSPQNASGSLGKRKRKDSTVVSSVASSTAPVTSEQPPSKKQKQELNPSIVRSVAAAALQVVKNSQDSSSELFSECQPILMHFILFKVPKTPFRQIRCELPHSPLPPDPDVCLIVPDMEKGRKTDEELSRVTEAYSEQLQERGFCAVKEVIPFGKLRAEYGAFEMKRRLAKSFDIFLCDGRIQGHVVHFLGKTFAKAKKIPIPIHAMAATGPEKTAFVPNLKENINRAMRKVYFTLHGHGTSYTVQIGHSSHTEQQLTENILALWEKIHQELPGGVLNIKSVYLKGLTTVGIPMFASFIPIKHVPASYPKKKKPVIGELSTHLGKKVVVFPSGDVKVISKPTQEEMEFSKRCDEIDKNQKKKKNQKKRDGNESDATSDEDESNGDLAQSNMSLVDNTAEESGGEEDSDNDDDVDSAENAYLSGLRH